MTYIVFNLCYCFLLTADLIPCANRIIPSQIKMLLTEIKLELYRFDRIREIEHEYKLVFSQVSWEIKEKTNTR